jgi:tRNA(Ile)-lysidine synthase
LPEVALAELLNALYRPAHILVAISGGSDSTGLLVALAEMLKNPSFSDIAVSAATVDHALRTESAGEARDVAALCSRLGVRHITRRWEGFKPVSGIMAAAREARYGLLADIAAEISADVIVTAHTLDDQQETLAMRAARLPEGQSAATTGIADAVLFNRRIWIVRPLLGCRRADIRSFLTGRGIGWMDDPSNEDMHYERVRTRRRLADENSATPTSDPGEGRLAHSAAAAAWFNAHGIVHAGALCEIGREGLDVEEPVLAYALSRLAAVFGGQTFSLGRDRLSRILDFLRSGPSGRRTAGGVVFDLRRRGLYIMRESRGIKPLTLLPGENGVWDGRFEVLNRGATAIRVDAAAGGKAAFASDLPKAAVLRANAALPKIGPTDDAAGEADPSMATVTPYFAPFDRFLTRFDLIFADRLAVSFGRTRYLPPPL